MSATKELRLYEVYRTGIKCGYVKAPDMKTALRQAVEACGAGVQVYRASNMAKETA